MPANAGDAGLTQVPWAGKIPWRRERQLTLVWESHGQRSLVGYSPRGCKANFVAVGFPGCSASDESACIAGDPGSIPGSGRSTGEGIGYPLQNFWASLITQTVKNLLAIREIWIWSLGWKIPWRKEHATHSSILAWRIPWMEWPGRLHGIAESDRTEWLSLHFTLISNVFFIIKFYKDNVCEIFKEVTFDLFKNIKSIIVSVIKNYP